MGHMAISKFQPCHPPVPLSCPDNGSTFSVGENCWTPRARGIVYMHSITGAGEKIAYGRPEAVYQFPNHRDFSINVENGNYHTFSTFVISLRAVIGL